MPPAMSRPIVAFLVALAMLAGASAARAETATQEIVDKSKIAFESLVAEPDMTGLRNLLPRARGIFIVPTLIKAGFIFGAEGGSGVLLARTGAGTWSYPAFFTMGAGSFGLQIGVEAKEVVFLLMTDRAVNAVITSEVKLGADASFAIGPVGRGIEGSTTTAVGADIVAFSRGIGAFAGAAFEGAVIHERERYDGEYYQPGATAREIVTQGKWMNPGAEALRNTLAKY